MLTPVFSLRRPVTAWTLVGLLILSLVFPALNFKSVAAANPSPKNQTQTQTQLPLSFEANVGQYDPQVKYAARAGNYSLFLAANEVVIKLNKQASLRLSWLGGNANPTIVSSQELDYKTNYFRGQNPAKWLSNIPNYRRIEYQNIYPGINLVFYDQSASRQLKYDLVVAAGADASQIRLNLSGASQLKLNDKGQLLADLSSGIFLQDTPLIYQAQTNAERQIVQGSYTLAKDNQIGFEIGAYDHTRPLIIDPALKYSTFLGGTSFDTAYDIAVDNVGNAYVTGNTLSDSFPVSGTTSTINGFTDVFVAKFDSLGRLKYSTFLGGDTDTTLEAGYAIAIDNVGNAYVTGFTDAQDFPVQNAFRETRSGLSDAFVLKLNASGNSLLYATYFGGDGNENMGNFVGLISGEGFGDIAVDSIGNAYITGVTNSSVNFPLQNAVAISLSGTSDAFVAKLNTNQSGRNSLLYSTYFGGNGLEIGSGIAIDSAGDAYITGNTSSSTGFSLQNPISTSLSGATDAFVARFSPALSGTASLRYSTYLGGSGDELGYGLTTDNTSGIVYVTGSTNSAFASGVGFPVTSGAYQTELGGGTGAPEDAFLSRIDTNLSGLTALRYSTYLGGAGTDVGYRVATRGDGTAYITGFTDSLDYPLASPLVSSTLLAGNEDAFVSSLNTNLVGTTALKFSTYLGGSESDYARGIALDRSNNIYIAGYTQSANFPTQTPYQATLRGNQDAFVSKIALGRNLIVTQPTDDGTGTLVNSLSDILRIAVDGDTITFAIPGTNIITESGPVPPVPAGVTMDGGSGCTNGNPNIIISGSGLPPTPARDGLVLGGRNVIIGIRVESFPGREIVARTGGNVLSCVFATQGAG